MSKMVAIEDLSPGAVLADAVLTINGRVLLGKGITLTNRHLSLLHSWDVQTIFIETADEDVPQILSKENSPKPSDNSIRFHLEYASILSNVSESFSIIKQNYIIPVSSMSADALRIHTTIIKNFELLNYLLTAEKNTEQPISDHSLMVAYLSGFIAHHLNWTTEDIQNVTLAALLHDIGSLVAVRPKISSTDAHIAETARLLKLAKGLTTSIILGIVQHREYLDGTGFPQKLSAPTIQPYARVIALADTFYNLSYTPHGVNPFTTLDTLQHSLYEKFDPNIGQTFINCVKDRLLLNKVRLSNGQEAEVIFFNKLNYSMPVVKTAQQEILDLSARKDLRIMALA